VKVSMRADEQVLVLRIDRSEVPHEVPDIRTYAELVNFADVDRDAHTLGQFRAGLSIILEC
jgi:hypothetical protein